MQYLEAKDIPILLKNIISSNNIPLKSKEAVRSRRIIHIITRGRREYFWIFKGRNRDYIIIPEYSCTCKDFIIHVVSEKNRRPCYHLIAQKIAEIEKKYLEVKIEEEAVIDDILLEILWHNYSPTLRRILIASAPDKGNS